MKCIYAKKFLSSRVCAGLIGKKGHTINEIQVDMMGALAFSSPLSSFVCLFSSSDIIGFGNCTTGSVRSAHEAFTSSRLLSRHTRFS